MLRRGMQAVPNTAYPSFTPRRYRAEMPTVLHLEGFRFFFYSREGHEPRHIHVEHGDKLAKYWLEPVKLAASSRFRSHELARLHSIVLAHRQAFLEAWDEHFGGQDGSDSG